MNKREISHMLNAYAKHVDAKPVQTDNSKLDVKAGSFSKCCQASTSRPANTALPVTQASGSKANAISAMRLIGRNVLAKLSPMAQPSCHAARSKWVLAEGLDLASPYP